MKNRIIRLFLLASVLGLMVEAADAQVKKNLHVPRAKDRLQQKRRRVQIKVRPALTHS